MKTLSTIHAAWPALTMAIKVSSPGATQSVSDFCPEDHWLNSWKSLISHTQSYRVDPYRRQAWSQQSLAPNLSSNLQLPHDVAWEIASHLARQYAAASLWSLNIDNGPSRVSIFAPIQQQFRYFEGRQYLKDAVNIPQGDHKAPRYVFTAEDGLGIIRLLLSGDGSPQDNALPGVWWKAFPVPGSGILTLHKDVSTQ